MSLGITFRHWNQERFKASYIKLKNVSANVHSVLNSSDWLLFKEIWSSKHLADSCWNTFQRHKPHMHSVIFSLFFICDPLNHLYLVYKRGKAIPFLGSFHGSDVPEFYGSSGPNGTAPDFIGTDALGMFSNSSHVYRCRADAYIQ